MSNSSSFWFSKSKRLFVFVYSDMAMMAEYIGQDSMAHIIIP